MSDHRWAAVEVDGLLPELHYGDRPRAMFSDLAEAEAAAEALNGRLMPPPPITPTCDEDDEALDRMFGPGQWVRCDTGHPPGVHHRAYHRRADR